MSDEELIALLRNADMGMCDDAVEVIDKWRALADDLYDMVEQGEDVLEAVLGRTAVQRMMARYREARQ